MTAILPCGHPGRPPGRPEGIAIPSLSSAGLQWHQPERHRCEADMNELAGKVGLGTGGSRGIGAAIARRLAGAGAAVALTYVTAADKAQAVAKQIDADGGRVLVIQADNADPGAVTAAVSQTVTHFGQIDILVNNAGIVTGGPLDDMTVEQADRLWAIDVRAVFTASQAAARHMSEGGRIITIGSALA